MKNELIDTNTSGSSDVFSYEKDDSFGNTEIGHSVNDMPLSTIVDASQKYSDFHIRDNVELEEWMLIPNVEDSIKELILVEHLSPGGYIIQSSDLKSFDAKRFDMVYQAKEVLPNNIILKIPSRTIVKKSESIHLHVKLLKNDDFFDDNIMIKFLSQDFVFSDSMLKLSEEESKTILTKKGKSSSCTLKMKIYQNNEVVKVMNIDLYERNLWE